jgi:hypothetical protein
VKLSQRCRGQAGEGQWRRVRLSLLFVWERIMRLSSPLSPPRALASEYQSLIRSAIPAKATTVLSHTCSFVVCHDLAICHKLTPKRESREGQFQLLNVAALWPHSWLWCSMGRVCEFNETPAVLSQPTTPHFSSDFTSLA